MDLDFNIHLSSKWLLDRQHVETNLSAKEIAVLIAISSYAIPGFNKDEEYIFTHPIHVNDIVSRLSGNKINDRNGRKVKDVNLAINKLVLLDLITLRKYNDSGYNIFLIHKPTITDFGFFTEIPNKVFEQLKREGNKPSVFYNLLAVYATIAASSMKIKNADHIDSERNHYLYLSRSLYKGRTDHLGSLSTIGNSEKTIKLIKQLVEMGLIVAKYGVHFVNGQPQGRILYTTIPGNEMWLDEYIEYELKSGVIKQVYHVDPLM
ncbi:TPA: hypothetical protein ACGO1T_000518 [Streptococcus suis]